jgi:hypothetical protein
LQAKGLTELKEHAIASAQSKGYPQIAANSGGNFVYTVNTGKDGANRLAGLSAHGAGTVRLEVTKSQNSIPSFSLSTSLYISFPVMNVKCPIGTTAFDALQGQLDATVQIIETNGGCEAKLVGPSLHRREPEFLLRGVDPAGGGREIQGAFEEK